MFTNLAVPGEHQAPHSPIVTHLVGSPSCSQGAVWPRYSGWSSYISRTTRRLMARGMCLMCMKLPQSRAVVDSVLIIMKNCDSVDDSEASHLSKLIQLIALKKICQVGLRGNCLTKSSNLLMIAPPCFFQ